MGSISKVGQAIEKAFKADALTVACQVRPLIPHSRLQANQTSL